MKITNKIFQGLNLANEEDRGENLMIDFTISSLVAIAIAYLTYYSFWTAFLIYLCIRFLYYFSFEYLYGRTPGKYETQTKVVNIKGEKPSLTQLIIRNTTRFISLISGISDNERAIHDIASDTYVIKNEKLKRYPVRKGLELLIAILGIIYSSNKLVVLDIKQNLIETCIYIYLGIISVIIAYRILKFFINKKPV